VSIILFRVLSIRGGAVGRTGELQSSTGYQGWHIGLISGGKRETAVLEDGRGK